MKALSGKEFRRVLERNGWKLLRINGSHHIYCKEGSRVRISVPVHGNKPLRIGLLKFFLKQADLHESDLG